MDALNVFAVVALLVLPLVLLRGRTLVRYYAVDAASWVAAAIVAFRAPGLDMRFCFIALGVAKLATLFLFVARGGDVRWSANRAALVAAVLYALAFPEMTQVKIDGDEPFYLLLTESIVRDADLDLANQYANLRETASGRTDLVPQQGDPVGAHGEQYSRLEPFLPLLMAPLYLLLGLPGAVATIALFGVLLVRSTVRWMEDEGIDDVSIRAVFPLFAFAPPVLFYAVRLWPEVPAAFFFVEALRGIRGERMKRWIPALLGFVLLKLRFLLVAAVLLAMMFRRRGRSLLAIPLLVLVPLGVMWLAVGNPTSVHSWRHLLLITPERFAIGFSGLLADGLGGIAFQAPFYLLGLFALTRWRSTPSGFRTGMLASLLYLLLLLPRGEWFGGWAPPLRYIVFLTPILALGAAAVWHRVSNGAKCVIALWSAGLVIHGLTWPWRLFHLFNGEAPLGEWLSTLHGADFSRLVPSYIRFNDAAWFGAPIVLLLVLSGLRRSRVDLALPLFALLMAAAFHLARQPGRIVHFEDAHVRKSGGDLYPELYAKDRWIWPGGWVLQPGQTATFLAREGRHTMHAATGVGAAFELDGRVYHLPPSATMQRFPVQIARDGSVTLRCLSGAVNVDRMEQLRAVQK
jgi:hypothetical protein